MAILLDWVSAAVGTIRTGAMMLKFLTGHTEPKPRLIAFSGPARLDRTVIFYEIDNIRDAPIYIDSIRVNGRSDGMRYGDLRCQDSLEAYHDTFVERGETSYGMNTLYQYSIPARTRAQSLVSIPGHVGRIDFTVLIRSGETRRPTRLTAVADDMFTFRPTHGR